jgi:hydroxyacylglutathione hydrolase
VTARRASAHGDFDLRVLTNGEFAEHGYCVEHRATKAALVVDPGWGTREELLALAAGGTRIERILLTHGHFDHVGAVQQLCEALGLTADVHEGDRALLRQAQLYSMRWERKLVPVPKRVRFFTGEPVWEWAGGAIETIETPGHTAGSVTYRIGALAFTGDTVFHRKVGPTFYPGGDRPALLASVAKLLERLPPETTLLAGHGRPWTVEAARAWWAEAAHAPETFDIYKEQGESRPAGAQVQRDA